MIIIIIMMIILIIMMMMMMMMDVPSWDDIIDINISQPHTCFETF